MAIPRATSTLSESSDEIREEVISPLDPLSLDLTEEKVKEVLGKRVEDAEAWWEKTLSLKEVRKENEQRWLNNNLEVSGNSDLYDFQVPYKDNRIFLSVETLVSNTVAKMPLPEVVEAQDTDASRELATNYSKVLYRKSEDLWMKQKLQMVGRHLLMGYRTGIIKVSWDFNTGRLVEEKPIGNVAVNFIRPHRIVIEEMAEDPDDIGLIAESMKGTVEELGHRFPDKKDDLVKAVGADTGTKVMMGSTIGYREIWFSFLDKEGIKREGVCWRYGKDLILDYGINPYFNYDNDKTNYFERPKKPYIFFNYLRTGKYVYDDSVSADTPVIIRRNKKFVDILPIEELAPNYANKDNGYCEKYRHVAKSIEALNKEGKWCPIDYVYRHKVKKDIYTVVTGSGVAKVTGDHSLFANSKEVKVSSLKVGDKVDLIPTLFITDNNQFSSEYAFLLGFFVADGWCGSRKYGHSQDAISISQKNKKVLERLQPIVEDYWSKKFEIRKSKDMYSLQLIAGRNGKSSTMVNWFRENFYTRSGEKRIPISILNSSLETKMAFLEGYWEGDGWGKLKSKKPAKCSTKSFVLAAGIGYLLNQVGYEFGVYCRNDKESNFEIKIHRSKKRKILPDQIKEIRKKQNNDFVYDLGIGDKSHSFVGGVGFLAFHNTSLTEQASTLQDVLEKRGRQIVESADQAVGTKIFNTMQVDADAASKYTGDPRQNILVKGDTRTAFSRVAPDILPRYVLEDKYDARQEIDNMFGTHAPLRGEKTESPTLGQEILSQRSDLGRQIVLSEAIEKGAKQVFEHMTQQFKVFAEEEHWVRYTGMDTGKTSFIQFSNDKIEDGVEIRVQAGSMKADDKMTDRTEAVELAKTGKIIDPLTFAEKWHIEKPREKAKRSFFYQFLPDRYLSEVLEEGDSGGGDEAMQTIQRINAGENVPPKENPSKEYLAYYKQYVQSPAFKQLDPEIQRLHIEHLRATIESAKGGLSPAEPGGAGAEPGVEPGGEGAAPGPTPEQEQSPGLLGKIKGMLGR